MWVVDYKKIFKYPNNFYLISISLNVVNIAFTFWASFKRSAIRNRIRFILTLYSDLVPDISLVGSAGGNLTVAACCFETCGAATAGAATLGGGGGCDVGWDGVDVTCGGGVFTGAATTGVSTGFGVSSTLGADLAGAGVPSKYMIKC